jgi:hypothetical protein
MATMSVSQQSAVTPTTPSKQWLRTTDMAHMAGPQSLHKPEGIHKAEIRFIQCRNDVSLQELPLAPDDVGVTPTSPVKQWPHVKLTLIQSSPANTHLS